MGLKGLKNFQHLKKRTFNLYDHLQILATTDVIQKESNLLKDLDLVWAICVSITSNITCGRCIESVTYFFLHDPFFIKERRTLLSTISSIETRLLDKTDSILTQALLLATSLIIYTITLRSLPQQLNTL